MSDKPNQGPPPKGGQGPPGYIPPAPLGPSSKAYPKAQSIQLAHPGQLMVNSDPTYKYPSRMTVGAHQRLADLNFDPLEWSVKIARGEALTTNHPFLQVLKEWYADIQLAMSKGLPVYWEKSVETMLEKATASLTDSWVPLNLRSDHIKELMQYLYPKLKAVEHSGSIQQDIRIKPLTRDEVAMFKEVFNEEY